MPENHIATKRVAAAGLGKRARSKADKLSRIIAAARELFFSHGYEGTTTQAVAKRAGIGAGTLFSYAQTKEDLLIMVFIGDLIEAAKQSRLRAQKKQDLLDRIYTLYLGLLDYHFAHLQLSRNILREVIFCEYADRRHDVERLVDLLTGSVTNFILDDMGGRALADDTDVPRLSENCFSIYYMTMLKGITTGDPLKTTAKELRARLAVQIEPLCRRAQPVSDMTSGPDSLIEVRRKSRR